MHTEWILRPNFFEVIFHLDVIKYVDHLVAFLAHFVITIEQFGNNMTFHPYHFSYTTSHSFSTKTKTSYPKVSKTFKSEYIFATKKQIVTFAIMNVFVFAQADHF